MEDPRLAAIKGAISARGWRWRPGKPIPFGEQLLVSDGVSEASLDFYPKRGRCVIGGAGSALRQALGELVERLEREGREPGRLEREPGRLEREGRESDEGREPGRLEREGREGGEGRETGRLEREGRESGEGREPRRREDAKVLVAELGMDESGKGDWFGPLVVAAVYVEPEAVAALRKAGVRDSKLLLPEELAQVAGRIEALLPAAAREVLVLEPAAYNRRYAALGNINLLLAELYVETAAPIVARTGATTIICDQFSQRADRLNSVFARAGLPRPQQMHHAEATSIAVAAASVLATTRFRAELVRLGALAGLGGPLPPGASAITLLRRAARAILAREGAEGLGRYAKLNFKPVQELLGR